MDTAGIISELEAALSTQLQIAGGDPAFDMEGQAIVAWSRARWRLQPPPATPDRQGGSRPLDDNGIR